MIPLGGLGEFGMNCLALRYEDDIIVIDAGMMFPDAELMGVDIVTPDFTYLEENKKFVRALLLTHGHEDHIGALPFLLTEIDIPVYGTAFTLALVERRLEEHEMLDQVKLHRIKPGQVVQIGPFQVEFIHVTHSIVSAVALAITTPLGVVIHTGDFKVDPTPTDNILFDLHTLASYGKRGVLLLLSDSTNVAPAGLHAQRTGGDAALRGDLQSRRTPHHRLLFFELDPPSATDSGHLGRNGPEGRISGPQHVDDDGDCAQPGPAAHSRQHAHPPAGHHVDAAQPRGGRGLRHAGRTDVGDVANRGRQPQEPVVGQRRHRGTERAHDSWKREGDRAHAEPRGAARVRGGGGFDESAGARFRARLERRG